MTVDQSIKQLSNSNTNRRSNGNEETEKEKALIRKSLLTKFTIFGTVFFGIPSLLGFAGYERDIILLIYIDVVAGFAIFLYPYYTIFQLIHRIRDAYTEFVNLNEVKFLVVGLILFIGVILYFISVCAILFFDIIPELKNAIYVKMWIDLYSDYHNFYLIIVSVTLIIFIIFYKSFKYTFVKYKSMEIIHKIAHEFRNRCLFVLEKSDQNNKISLLKNAHNRLLEIAYELLCKFIKDKNSYLVIRIIKPKKNSQKKILSTMARVPSTTNEKQEKDKLDDFDLEKNKLFYFIYNQLEKNNFSTFESSKIFNNVRGFERAHYQQGDIKYKNVRSCIIVPINLNCKNRQGEKPIDMVCAGFVSFNSEKKYIFNKFHKHLLSFVVDLIAVLYYFQIKEVKRGN